MNTPAWLFLALALAGCAPSPEATNSPVSAMEHRRTAPAPREENEALIARLNARFNHTVAACADSTPAYYCSGLVVRPTNVEHFWEPSAAATTLGSVTFAYLRRDQSIEQHRYSTGLIFADLQTAISQNKPYVARCMYPFIADTQARPANGCGMPSTAAARHADQSACQSLTPPVTDAASWVAHFQLAGSNTRRQCSLSTLNAAQFQASLDAHEQVQALKAATNELLIATWDPQQPQTLPLEAIYYDSNVAQAMGVATRMQAAYLNATGITLPIVDLNLITRLDPGPGVAQALNHRFNKVDNSCNGRAAFYCDGVLVRVTEWGPGYYVWNPSPASVRLGAVSFSYVRRDLGITELAWDKPFSAGIIFKDVDTAITDGDESIQLLCSFPSDAASVNRANNGCGAHVTYPEASIYCSAKTPPIDTLEKWETFYNEVSGGGQFGSRNKHQCSFHSGQAAFALSLAVRQHFTPQSDKQFHNEILLRAWSPRNDPSHLPIQAFFYHERNARAVGLEGAQQMQVDYKKCTGRFMPIVKVTLTNLDTPFTYEVADQAVDGEPITPPFDCP